MRVPAILLLLVPGLLALANPGPSAAEPSPQDKREVVTSVPGVNWTTAEQAKLARHLEAESALAAAQARPALILPPRGAPAPWTPDRLEAAVPKAVAAPDRAAPPVRSLTPKERAVETIHPAAAADAAPARPAR